MRTFLLLTVVGLACWLAGARSSVQETRDASADVVPMAKPTAEHKELQDRVGVWDASFKMWMGPEAMESKATMTYEGVGDFWVLGRYEGEFMGQPFTGFAIEGFDPETGEHVSYWIDSTSPEFTEMRGKWDAKTSSMTMHSVEPAMNHMTGEEETMFQKLELEDDDTLVLKMWPESATKPTMEITYHRRK